MAKSLLLLSLAGLVSLAFASVKLENKVQGSGNPYDIVDVNYMQYGIIAQAKYHLGRGGIDSPDIIQKINISITYDNPNRLRVKIFDPDNKRWEVPGVVLSYSPQDRPLSYKVDVNESPMGIKVTRKSDDKVMFNIDPSDDFLFANQEIRFLNNLGYNIKVIGLGERVTSYILRPGQYTLWARDRTSPIDYGKPDEPKNMYSMQPMYAAIDDSLDVTGGFLLNSNMMEAYVNSQSVGFRFVGGIIDYWVFTGPSMADVVDEYHKLIGTPTLIPYWSLGWHQCRYGYHSLEKLKNVTNDYMKYNLPLDVMWSDIDYMYQYRDFTLDPERYPHDQFASWVHGLHNLGKHFVPITDAGVAQQNYKSYNDGVDMDVWIKSPYEPSQPACGKVWPGRAVFVDWTHPNATTYWINQMDVLSNLTFFSGSWLDMNEVSNFINGDCDHNPTLINNTTMTYTPGGQGINTRSLDAAATHYYGHDEYNMHSLFGFLESKATNKYFTQHKRTRPFIISRSSYPGHGRYASKWLGDNYSEWSFLEYSITGIYNFQMFGIHLIGADICGFLGNTTQELCQRWMQLGTLYPFSRNHNDIHSVSQEPWAFGRDLITTSNEAIRNKYLLSLYYYSGMFRLSLEGGMFFRPAFYDYGRDKGLLATATEHFMLGDALIVHPCLWEGMSGRNSYFPYDIWYNFYNGSYIELDWKQRSYVDMPILGKVPIHMRAGYIVPTVDEYDSVLNMRDLRRSNITLVVAPNGSFQAEGFAIFDDGLSVDTMDKHLYTYMEYSWSRHNSTSDYLTLNQKVGGYKPMNGEHEYISTIVVYGCDKGPYSVQKIVAGKVFNLRTNIYWNPQKELCHITFFGGIRSYDIAKLVVNYYI